MAEAAFTTYEQNRLAEDVQDVIYNISPVDNPVASMSRTTKASGKIHGWTEDALRDSAANARVEGADATAAVHTAVTEKSNYCQIMDERAQISGTLEEVDKYGRESEMAYELEKKYSALAKDEEFAIVGTGQQAGTAGDEDTARQLKSLQAQMHADVTEDGSASTSPSDLEANILDCHQALYDEGANPGYMVVAPNAARWIAAFAAATGRQRDIANTKTLAHVIELYISPYGELDVVLDRELDPADILLMDFEYCSTPVLRPTRDWALGKSGDSDKRQILRESTFALLNSKACGRVDGIVPANIVIP